MTRYLSCLFLGVLLLLSAASQAADKVVLQLKWEHQFQFAGYYAALWKGFYAREGLDVEIRPVSRPDGSRVSPAEEVRAGRADFAVGATDILINRDRGDPFVVVAPVFQRSPNALFSLESVPLDTVQDLAGLKIGINNTDFTGDETRVLLSEKGIAPDQVALVPVTPSLELLGNGTVDVIATYGVSALFEAQEKGIALNRISPAELGLAFYGDTLYTHQRLAEQNPELVERFLRATLTGWQYALAHKAELARQISKQLPRHLFSYADLQAYNLAFADIIETYMAYPLTKVGHNNPARWQSQHQQLKAIGIITHDWDEKLLFSAYQQSLPEIRAASFEWAFMLCVLLCLAATLLAVRRTHKLWLPCLFVLAAAVASGFFLEKRLQQEHYRKASLEASQQLNALAGRLAGTLNNNLSLLTATAAHIAVHPNINQAEFSRFAKPLLQRDSHLLNITAAYNLVANLTYPLERNRAVLGLDYRQHPTQREAVLAVKNQGLSLVTGPVDLLQGGSAFIGRAPVNIETPGRVSAFWGIVSAPIRAETLYQHVGLTDPELPLDITIAAEGKLGQRRAAFFGDDSLFVNPQSVKTRIDIGDSSWILAAQPKQGWQRSALNIWAMRTGIALAALMALLFIVYRARQYKKYRAYDQQIRQNERLLSDVGKLALIGAWKMNANNTVKRWHVQTSKVLEMDYPVSGHFIEQLRPRFPSDQLEQLRAHLEHSKLTGTPFDLEVFRFNSRGEKCWLRFIGDPVLREDWRYDIIGAVQDISERKKSTEIIQYQASFDTLTGLPNRFLLSDRLNKAISKAQRDDAKLALLFVDLDNFKPVNDSLGHEAGDQLLKKVARRISDCVRKSDTVARYSGDEFIVVLQDVDDGSGSLKVAEQLVYRINQPYRIKGREVFCGASIGIAIYPEDGDTSQALISNADKAMYEVKKSGRNGWHYFTDKMQAQSEKRHRMHNRLQSALGNRQLDVHFQPIIELETGRVSKCEALVRWFDEELGQVSTEEFIGLAEEMGMVNEIDFFVLEEAGRYLSTLVRKEGIAVGLSVNVSPRIFSSKDRSLERWLALVTEVASQIDVTVEITERVLTQDSEKAFEALRRLKEAGISIAIDDFGTGYSSLSYLTKFPIDLIKIDRSFIANIGHKHSAETLTETIISLGNKLDMQVVAEGVESEAQLSFLQNLGCDYAQGYLLGKPQCPETFTTLLRAFPTDVLPSTASRR